MAEGRSLLTRHGPIYFPAYIPTTTFGQKYPLDDLILPYLPRLAQGAMVSYYYAPLAHNAPQIPHRRRRDVFLFACVQGWSPDIVRACVRAYAGAVFDGITLGGIAPRVRDLSSVLTMVEVVHLEIEDLPLHVFEMGEPGIVEALFRSGVDLIDSSFYVKLAASGRIWNDSALVIEEPTPTGGLHLAICNMFTVTWRVLPPSSYRLVFKTEMLSQREKQDTKAR